LADHGIHLKYPRRAWMFIKERAALIRSMVRNTFKAATVGAKIALPGLPVDAASEAIGAISSATDSRLIKRFLSITASDIAFLISSLGTRRVVVFIDDLDRADPKLIPPLLLTLRELLDFSHFVFVMAFDREIVAEALHLYNPAWGDSGEKFLEKIIDFPMSLPPPTNAQVLALGTSQLALLAPFVPRSALEDIASLLPRNPRRLKLFIRLVGSLGIEVRRHEPEELDWASILVFFLIRIESERFASWLVDQINDDGSDGTLMWLHGFSDKAEDKEAFIAKLNGDFADLSPEMRERLIALIEGWRSRRSMLVGELIAYQLSFFAQPHAITWKEFKTFLSEWLAHKDASLAWKFILERAKESDLDRAEVVKEFVDTLVAHYGNLLDRAANTEAMAEHWKLIEEATAVLGLLRKVYFEGLGYFGPDKIQTPDLWARILKICLSWIHFTTNSGEAELRQAETSFLEDSCKGTAEPEALLDVLKPWQSQRSGLDQRVEDLQEARIKSLAVILYPRAIENALLRFSLDSGIQQLLSKDEHLVHRYLLSAPQSPLFQGRYRLDLLGKIDEAKISEVVRNNCDSYLRFLMLALEGEDRFCDRNQRKAFFAGNTDLVAGLWTAIVLRPVQYRFLESIRKRRATLLSCGVNDETLPIPDWLRARG